MAEEFRELSGRTLIFNDNFCFTLLDVKRMYNVARCCNWEELKKRQIMYKQEYDYRKVSKASANDFNKFNDDNLQFQKKYVNLPCNYFAEYFYGRVFKK